MNQQFPGAQVSISEDQLREFESLKCGVCGGKEFIETIEVKRLPIILSPEGQGGIIRIKTLKCIKCGTGLNPITGVSKDIDDGKKQETGGQTPGPDEGVQG